MRLPFSRTLRQLVRDVNGRRFVDRVSRGYTFSDDVKSLMVHEWCDWERNYLPVDVRGKVVLDVGAGEGETALFYLLHGARRVICVEADLERYRFLKCNEAYDGRIVAIGLDFQTWMLRDYPHDFLKCDVEGYEECLLDVVLPSPAVVEVHGLQLRDKFRLKGFRVGERFGRSFLPFSTVYAFWMC